MYSTIPPLRSNAELHEPVVSSKCRVPVELCTILDISAMRYIVPSITSTALPMLLVPRPSRSNTVVSTYLTEVAVSALRNVNNTRNSEKTPISTKNKMRFLIMVVVAAVYKTRWSSQWSGRSAAAAATTTTK
jgi:hypothetical protein